MANVFSHSTEMAMNILEADIPHSLSCSLSISKLHIRIVCQGMNVYIFIRGYLPMVLDELEVLLKHKSLNKI